MESRGDRISKNEALFRDVNERVRAIDARLTDVNDDAGQLWEFLCECGDATCIERVSMTNAEYEQVRAKPTLFAVVAGHERTDGEEVVDANERFAVVEKHVDEQEIARERDPRSGR